MRYQHLPLAEVRPGMILSDLLRDGHGAVLLAAGTALTDSMLHRLALHGIDSLPILVDGGGGNESDEQAAGAARARLEYVFRHNDPDDRNDWATGILRHYIETYRLGRGEAA